MRQENRKIFTTAYRSPRNDTSGREQYEMGVEMLQKAHRQIEPLTEKVFGARTLREAWQNISDLWNYGPFLATQITWDLSYGDLFPFPEEDQFPFVGDGAAPGIRAMFPEIPKSKSKAVIRQLDGKLVWLFEHQREYVGDDVPRLTLWDVQACCCEWRKYFRFLNGTGRPREYFTPISGEDLYGL